MLPHSQQQQNLRNIRRLAPISPLFALRFGRLGRQGVSREKFTAQSNQSGFTIIEALFAIIVVTILMAAVAPVLVLATANRVQGRRVETAVNAAKSYIDLVRTNPDLAPPINTSNNANASSAQYFANRVNPPNSSGFLRCDANQYCTVPVGNAVSSVFCIDGNGDSKCTNDNFKDMLVQAAGYQPKLDTTPSISNTERAKQGYVLSIRVYRADAFKDGSALQKSNNQTKAQARTNTAGLGNRKAPLVEMTTQIVTSDTKYQDLCDRIGGCQ